MIRRSHGSYPIPPPGRPRYGHRPVWWPRSEALDLGEADSDLRPADSDFGATSSGDVGLGAAHETWGGCGVGPEGVQVTSPQRPRACPVPRSLQQRVPLLSSCCLTTWLRVVENQKATPPAPGKPTSRRTAWAAAESPNLQPRGPAPLTRGGNSVNVPLSRINRHRTSPCISTKLGVK
jgi:hypothetical protein